MRSFRLLALSAMVPMLVLTLLSVVPLALYTVVTTLLFVFVSGRMVPAMAIASSASLSALRGTFMSLNGSLQSTAMGLASLLGGMLIHRAADGRVQGYGWCGWVAAGLSALAALWVSRVQQLGKAAGR